MTKSTFWIFFIIIVSNIIYTNLGLSIFETQINPDIKVSSWNIQVFGTSKSSNPNLLNFYVNYINKRDIVFIQEIRDKSGDAFKTICNKLIDFECINSSRAGRSTTKEQYGIIFRKGIKLIGFNDFNPDKKNRWERPPFRTIFEINNTKLTFYVIHIKPNDVDKELSNLETLLVAEKEYNSKYITILGDLNADCNYYNYEKNSHFENWVWTIKSNEDTTVGKSNCAYDRFIINKNLAKFRLSTKIYSQGINKSLSDHYPIELEIEFKEKNMYEIILDQIKNLKILEN